MDNESQGGGLDDLKQLTKFQRIHFKLNYDPMIEFQKIILKQK